MKRYNIIEEIVKSEELDEMVKFEDHKFLRTHKCSLAITDKYKMVTSIQTNFDEGNGFAAILPINCHLSPNEIAYVYESII